MAANATFALKPGVWFLRVRFVIFAPDSRREPSPPSGRKSTQPTVQILEASSFGGFLALDRAAVFHQLGRGEIHERAPPGEDRRGSASKVRRRVPAAGSRSGPRPGFDRQGNTAATPRQAP